MKPKYYGLNMPALNYGVTLTAEWKWFDFMALFQGAACYSIQIPRQPAQLCTLGR